MDTHKFNGADASKAFIFAGNAVFTLRSAITGTRYTYKVTKAEKREGHDNEPDTFFVKYLTGPDNMSDYTYMGFIRNNTFSIGRKGVLTMDSGPVVALTYALTHLVAGNIPQQLEIFHEGRCGRCGRRLTVPESVESGFGPECINLMGVA